MRMDLNRKNIKIFKVCIDNLDKMLYNVKRLLCFFVKNTYKAIPFCAIFFVLLGVFTVSAGSEHEREIITLELEVRSAEDGKCVEVFLLNPQSRDVCGLSVGVLYDSALVSFVSAEGQDNFDENDVFSYVDIGGCVKILIDRDENNSAIGLAVLRFLPIDPSRLSKASFKLFLTENVAACRFADGEVIPLEVFAVDREINVPEKDLKPDMCINAVPLPEEKFSLITLSASPFCEGIAAGFDVSVVSFASSETERFCAVEALPLSRSDAYRFEQKISVPKFGTVCVVVRPVVYNKWGAMYGKEKVLLIINGEICE